MRFLWIFAIFLSPAAVGGAAAPDCPEDESLIINFPPHMPIRPDPYLDFDKLGLGLISGHFELIDAAWEGLQTMEDFLHLDCASNYPQMSLTYNISADFIKLFGIYDIYLALVDLPLFPIRGTGAMSLHIDQLRLTAAGTGVHDNETDLVALEHGTMLLTLEGLSFHAEQLNICGAEVPWDLIPLLDIFNEFLATYKDLIDQLLLAVVEAIVGDCTVSELLEGGKIDCLNLPWEWEAANIPEFLSPLFRQQLAAQPMATLLQMLEETCEPTTPTTSTRTTTRTTTPGPSTTTTTRSSAMATRHGLWRIALIAIALIISIHFIFNNH